MLIIYGGKAMPDNKVIYAVYLFMSFIYVVFIN